MTDARAEPSWCLYNVQMYLHTRWQHAHRNIIGTCTEGLGGCCTSPPRRLGPLVGEEPANAAVPGDDPGAGGALTADDCVTLHNAGMQPAHATFTLM